MFTSPVVNYEDSVLLRGLVDKFTCDYDATILGGFRDDKLPMKVREKQTYLGRKATVVERCFARWSWTALLVRWPSSSTEK